MPSEGKQKPQKFLMEYEQYPCIKKSEKSEYHAYCTACKKDFLVSAGGKNDIVGKNGHFKSALHQNKAPKKNSLTSMGFTKEVDDTKLDVIHTECMVACFYVEHNLPITVSDHMTMLLRNMFKNCDEPKRNAP